MSRIRSAQPLVINTATAALRSSSMPSFTTRDNEIKQLQQENNNLEQQIIALKMQLDKAKADNAKAVSTAEAETGADTEEDTEGLAAVWDLPTRMPVGPGIYKTVRKG